jgi:predicted phosphoribosyltransferase
MTASAVGTLVEHEVQGGNVLFADRREAGRYLAQEMPRSIAREAPIVLALPRGGVPVGYEIARALHAPLDVFVVRKLGVPGHEELAMGAIASGGAIVLNDDVIAESEVAQDEIEDAIARETRELERRERRYRGNRPSLDLAGRTIVLVDDGLATGASMRVAINALRQRRPAKIIAAVPVAAAETCAAMEAEADLMICATTPRPFYGVGAWYQDFSQTSDGEVQSLLADQTAHAAAT